MNIKYIEPKRKIPNIIDYRGKHLAATRNVYNNPEYDNPEYIKNTPCNYIHPILKIDGLDFVAYGIFLSNMHFYTNLTNIAKSYDDSCRDDYWVCRDIDGKTNFEAVILDDYPEHEYITIEHTGPYRLFKSGIDKYRTVLYIDTMEWARTINRNLYRVQARRGLLSDEDGNWQVYKDNYIEYIELLK